MAYRLKHRVPLAAVFLLFGQAAMAQENSPIVQELLIIQEQIAGLHDQISELQSAEQKKFYLTAHKVDGNETKTACGEGYHMAVFAEILDPSNLQYDKEHPDALTEYQGWEIPHIPPFAGWVDNGMYPQSSLYTSTPMPNNCKGWTSDFYDYPRGYLGATISFLVRPFSDTRTSTPWWYGSSNGCNATNHVWCVSD